MRLLLLLILIAIVFMVAWAMWRRAQARLESDAGSADRYRVVETTAGTDAQVLIASGSRDSGVLIGSVPLADENFDERYAELVLRAEDRAATLNASRELHSGS